MKIRNYYHFLMTFTFIAALTLAGCSSDGKSWDNIQEFFGISNLPKKFTVEIPNTLTSRSEDEKRAVEGGLDTGAGSHGYNQLKNEIEKVELFASGFEIEFMMMDSFFQQMTDYIAANGGKTVPKGTLSVVFTKQMMNKMLEANSDLNMTLRLYFKIQEELEAAIGQTYPVPEVEYSADPSDSDGDNFNHSMIIRGKMGPAFTHPNSDWSKIEVQNTSRTLKWNNEKTKVFVAREEKLKETPNDIMGFSVPLSGIILRQVKSTHDEDTKRTTLQNYRETVPQRPQ